MARLDAYFNCNLPTARGEIYPICIHNRPMELCDNLMLTQLTGGYQDAPLVFLPLF
jgi:hypothetical protein